MTKITTSTLFLILLILINISPNSCLSDDTDSMKLDLGQSENLQDIVSHMRSKGIYVDYEAPVDVANGSKRVGFPKAGSYSVAEVLKAIGDSTKLTIQRNQNRISIFDSATRNDSNYPLNTKITTMDIEKLSPYDSVTQIEKKTGVPLNVFRLGHDNPGKFVTLSLKDITIRDALDQIAEAGGFSGWSSFPSVAQAGPNKGKIAVLIISFY